MGKAKILVVDDSPTHLKVECAALEEKGYSVVTASDGEEALAKAASEKPDLIVLDVVMPKLNGFQVCRKIKKSPETKNIKVLLCTSKNQESDKFWGEQQGADAYVTKPFSDEELLDTVAKLL
ncbi:MAG: response regulator [Desulfobacteraceae bacterium]|nr:response regulator [Desulfobacteraceae bacterium]MCP4347162.1 response regulator [Desulfobacterales bacterium]